MAYTLVAEDNLIRVTYTGTFTLSELEESRKEAAAHLLTAKSARILVDFTHATPETSFVEIFSFAGNHKADINPLFRTASIIPRDRFPNFYAYLEEVCSAFDNDIGFFDTADEALKWLQNGS